MLIQIFSDLHVDVAAVKPITIADGVDLVIVAGDTCEGVLNAFGHLRRIVPLSIPIVMVVGNHEYYRRFVLTELATAHDRAAEFNIHILECNTLIYRGVRFVGATLWTDYCIFGRMQSSMNVCASGMNDHKRIGWTKRPWRRFRPEEAALVHRRSRSFIAHALAHPFDGPTVVITHHAVHWDSIAPRYQTDPLTAAYVSDLTETITTYQPELWVHGHVHNSSDYRVGATRVICNPHGYGAENPAFDGSLTVRIGPGP